MPLPCPCCAPTTGCYQANTVVATFASVVAENGAPLSNLNSTIDGTSGVDLSGFVPPVAEATLVANPNWAARYAFAAPVNLARLEIDNGGGGILNDQDGLGAITVDLLDAGMAVLATVPWNLTPPAANNVPPRALDFAPVSNVSFVRLRGFHKQNVAVLGTGSPLWRQVRAYAAPVFETVFRCVTDGVTTWWDSNGDQVPTVDVITECPPLTTPVEGALLVTNLTMNEAALGDDPGLGERICPVPLPTSTTGYGAPVGGCYDGTAGADTMTWAGPISSVDITYSSNGSASAGAALISFTSPATGLVTWTANGVKMLVGESRNSLPIIGGGHVRVTYLGGTGTAPTNGTMSMDGGANLRIGPAAIQNFGTYTYRFEIFA